MAEGLAVAAIALAACALWLMLGLNRRLNELRGNPGPPPAPPVTDDALRREVEAMRRDLDQTIAELAELKAAANVLPGPPPSRPRRARDLDQLREQLRASHRESATESDDEPAPD